MRLPENCAWDKEEVFFSTIRGRLDSDLLFEIVAQVLYIILYKLFTAMRFLYS